MSVMPLVIAIELIEWYTFVSIIHSSRVIHVSIVVLVIMYRVAHMSIMPLAKAAIVYLWWLL